MTTNEKTNGAETIAAMVAVLKLSDDYKQGYIDATMNAMELRCDTKAVEQ